jgi:hypothetical protein
VTTQYQRGRDDGYQHGLRAGANSTGPAPVMRIPLSRNDFLAWWPDTVNAQDLRMMKAMFDVTMDAWISAVASKEQAACAADVEYESWLAKVRPLPAAPTTTEVKP